MDKVNEVHEDEWRRGSGGPELVLIQLLLCVSENFLWVVIRRTVAITGVMMGISLIYNPYRLLWVSVWVCKAPMVSSLRGQVGGLGVQNYPPHTPITPTTQGQGGGYVTKHQQQNKTTITTTTTTTTTSRGSWCPKLPTTHSPQSAFTLSLLLLLPPKVEVAVMMIVVVVVVIDWLNQLDSQISFCKTVRQVNKFGNY